jgi:hypothetical protein
MSDKPSLVDRTKSYFGTLFPPKAETVPELPDSEADENLYDSDGDEAFSSAARSEQKPSQNESREDGGWSGGGLLIGAEEEDGIDWKNMGADAGYNDPNDDGSAAYAKRISDAQEALFGATGLTNQMANARSGAEKDEFYNPTQSPEQSAPAQDPNVPPADAPQVGTPAADALFKEAFGKMTTPSADDPFTVGPKPPSHDTGDIDPNKTEKIIIDTETRTVELNTVVSSEDTGELTPIEYDEEGNPIGGGEAIYADYFTTYSRDDVWNIFDDGSEELVSEGDEYVSAEGFV